MESIFIIDLVKNNLKKKLFLKWKLKRSEFYRRQWINYFLINRYLYIQQTKEILLEKSIYHTRFIVRSGDY